MFFSVVALCQSLYLFLIFIWEESWDLSQSHLLSQNFQLRRSTGLQKRGRYAQPHPLHGTVHLIGAHTSAHEQWRNNCSVFLTNSCFSLTLLCEAWRYSSNIQDNALGQYLLSPLKHTMDRLCSSSRTRAVRVQGPAAAGMEPGPAAVLQWLQADLERYCRARERKGCFGTVWFEQTSLCCLLKLPHSFIPQWRRRCYWPHRSGVCICVHAASESLRSSYIRTQRGSEI